MAKYIEGMDTRMHNVIYEHREEFRKLIYTVISECIDSSDVDDMNCPEWRIAESLAIHLVSSEANIAAMEGAIRKSIDKRNTQNG